MLKVKLIGALAALSVLGVASAAVASNTGGSGPPNVVLVYNGPSIANTHSTPNTPAFSSWCGASCIPSVALPAVDASTGRVEGTMYVWTKNFQASGSTVCFGEFIWFALNDGDAYVNSGDHGTCGAVMDPSLKPATHVANAVDDAGGGDGTIVGGTGRYAKWTGTYTDRVFVELGAPHSDGSPNYYYDPYYSGYYGGYSYDRPYYRHSGVGAALLGGAIGYSIGRHHRR